tara:strand:- start:1054 stop:1773 length:720 start_codon:yes stop_codon:yes gene_type:complete
MKTNLPSISAPIYRDSLPSTNQEFTYRPFLVREEKLLQLIKDDNNVQQIYDSLQQLIKNCTGLDVNSLSVFDIEYIFLRLRQKSVGEMIELKMKHVDPDSECKHVEDVFMNLNNIEVVRNEEHSTTINLDSNRNLKLEMNYPKYNDILKLEKSQEFNTILQVLINCTSMIIDGDSVYETKDFSETELQNFFLQFSLDYIEKVKDFFNTMPKICYNLEWTCSKCGKKESHLIEGVQNFLS